MLGLAAEHIQARSLAAVCSGKLQTLSVLPFIVSLFVALFLPAYTKLSQLSHYFWQFR
jgi:hypothetical protein